MHNTNYGKITQQELEELGHTPIPEEYIYEYYNPYNLEDVLDEETIEQLSTRNY